MRGEKSNELPRAFALMQDVVNFHMVDNSVRGVKFLRGGMGNDVIALTLGSKWDSP